MIRAALCFTLLVMSVLGLLGPASAQIGPLDIFGGLLGEAQRQATREAWARLPSADRACLQRALATRNSDIESLARNGIGPDDSRVSSYLSQCRRFSETNLRRGISCTIRDEDFSGSTTCNQTFAYRDEGGEVHALEPREAAEMHFSGTRVFVTEVETDGARQARANRIEAQGRAEQLQVLRSSLVTYQRHPSPVVRAEVARLQGRIEQQLAAQTGPMAPDTEEIDRAVKALDPLSGAESARLSALDRLSSLRAQAEARTKDDTSDALKRRLTELRVAVAAVSEPPRTVPTLKAGTTTQRELGPSFDCEKAATPLPLMICEDAGLRRIDLELARPFYALRHLRPDDGAALKAESNDLVKRTLESCRVPETGKVTGALRTRSVPCIAAAYQRQKEAWAARVGREGPAGARQELARPITEHVRLQESLRRAGVLASDAPADGVYGSITRRAITAFAETEGLPADGFLSNALADRLGRRPSEAPGASIVVDPGLVTRIDAVANRFEGYLTELGSEERERSARTKAEAALTEQRARVQKALAGSVPDELKEELSQVLQQTEAQRVGSPRLVADEVAQRMAQLEPRLREAEAIQRAITDRNRFLVEGDPGDILLLYNSSPKAAGVARGLSGNLVFDPERMVACTLTEPPTDRIAQEQLATRARSLGAPVKDALTPCTSAQQQSADLIVFARGALRAQSGLFGTIASAVETGVYAQAGTLPKSDLEAVRQAEAIRAAEAEAEVARGSSEGIAIIAVGNGSHTLCRLGAMDATLHERLLKPYEALLRGELRGPFTVVASSADGAFLSAKRGQCGAISASAKEMAPLAKAFTRDGVTFRYLPAWIAPDVIEMARQELVDTDARNRRAQAERDRERGEEQARRDRQAMIERLNRSKADAEVALKTGVSPDLQVFLAGFISDVATIGPDTALTRLQELGDRYADKRGRIDEAARLTRALTPKSRFLIEGERGDLIVLYNDSGKAPSVVRNLRGELVFEDGRAVACLYHGPLADVFLNRQIRERTAALGARLELPLAACAPKALATYDLILAERDRLLREPIDRVIALADAINGGLYARLTVVDASALTAAKQAEAAKATGIEATVRDRKGEGFGVIVADNDASVVCRVGDANAEAQDAILSSLLERIGDELPSQPIISATSADGAFISVKRSECGAVYASASDLLALIEAMGRDGLRARFLPIWIESDEVSRSQASIDQEKRQRTEDQAARERELRDRDAVESDKAADQARKREALERALRAQWGERARFFEQALGEEAKLFADGRASTFTERYPKLARAYAAMRDDRWEYMSAQTTILDYGTAVYKERPLETALATTLVKMRNRLRGEYKELCIVTGYVNDAEFGLTRDWFGEPCEGSGPKLLQYKQGEQFTSRWIAP